MNIIGILMYMYVDALINASPLMLNYYYYLC